MTLTAVSARIRLTARRNDLRLTRWRESRARNRRGLSGTIPGSCGFCISTSGSSAAMVLGIAAYFLLPGNWPFITRLLVSWDVGLAIYVGAVIVMMLRADDHGPQQRAATQEDEGATAILLWQRSPQPQALARSSPNSRKSNPATVATAIMSHSRWARFCCRGHSHIRSSRYTMPTTFMAKVSAPRAEVS